MSRGYSAFSCWFRLDIWHLKVFMLIIIFGMQVDSSGLNVYLTIFRSVLCDHFQVRRNTKENFRKLILKWYIEY